MASSKSSQNLSTPTSSTSTVILNYFQKQCQIQSETDLTSPESNTRNNNKRRRMASGVGVTTSENTLLDEASSDKASVVSDSGSYMEKLSFPMHELLIKYPNRSFNLVAEF
jgi:hypothetical protein